MSIKNGLSSYLAVRSPISYVHFGLRQMLVPSQKDARMVSLVFPMDTAGRQAGDGNWAEGTKRQIPARGIYYQSTAG